MADTFNYITKQGETWSSVAWKMYGSVAALPVLVRYNPSVPLDPVFPDQTTLIIPVLDDTDSYVITQNLPPWK